MTDMYGNEPGHEAGHDEAVGGDHAEIHEAPSDYEFSDDGAASSEHTEEHVMHVTETKLKGRSPLLPIIAAVGGIALLAGVAWWQFGGGNILSSPSVEEAPLTHPTVAINQPVSQPPAPISTPQALPVAPKVSETSSTDGAVTPAPAPQAPAALNPVAPTPAITPEVASPASVPPSPVEPSLVTPINPPVSVSNSPIGSPPLSLGKENQRVEALASRMDDLQKSLNQVTEQLSQMTTIVAASGSSMSGDKNIEERLDKLEQQVGRAHHNAPTLSAPATLTADDGSVAIPASVSPEPSKAVHHEVEHEIHKAEEHHAKPHNKPIVIESKGQSVAHWVLRAAIPGQAWIAPNGTDKDLKPVHVGDVLQGIGRVTAIEPKDGDWVVEGTKGSLD